MIGALWRQDPATGNLRILAVVSLACGLLLASGHRELPDGFGSVAPAALGGVMIVLYITAHLLSLFFLVTAGFWTRSTQFQTTLPLPTRRLWLVRTTSVLIGWLFPMAVMTLFLAFGSVFEEGTLALDRSVLAQATQTGSFILLAMVLVQMPMPGLAKIALSPRYILYAVAVGFLSLMVSFLTAPSPKVTLLVSLAALALAVWSFLRVPPGYVLAPARSAAGPVMDLVERASPAGSGPAAAAVISDSRSSWLLQWTALRLLLNWPPIWLIGAIVVIYGMAIPDSYRDGRSPWAYVFFLSLWFVAMVSWTTSRLHWLDSLPISRRRLLPYAVLPFITALLLGVGISEALHHAAPRSPSLVRYDDHQILVPPEFWEIAPGGSAPVIRAPWGETHVPAAYPPVRGHGPAVYLPFERGADSSPEFIAWQLERAARRVHVLPDGFTGDAYWTNADSLRETISCYGRCGFSLRSTRGLASPLHRRTLALGVLLTVAATIPLTIASMRAWRPGPGRWVGRAVLPAVGLSFALIFIGVLVGLPAGITSKEFMDAYLPLQVRRLAESLPLSARTIWLLACAVGTIGYLLIQSAFMKIEAKAKKREFLAEYDA